MNEQNSRKKINIFKIICVTLALIITLYCIASLVIMVAADDPLPMPLGFGSAVVLTGSMEPTLSVNDLIFFAKSGEYNVGDIVVYSTGGIPIVHRVVQADMQSGVIVTRGDANNTDDDPISVARIKGKLFFSLPFVGAIPRFVRTVPGLIMVLLILFALLFVSVRGMTADNERSDKAEELLQEIERLKKELDGYGDNDSENDKKE
ncbi:MAG: signal peptidase I [Oscillospiraceae bacterium]|nr:signal peptidase I [Oscillospiraceae bacterium]